MKHRLFFGIFFAALFGALICTCVMAVDLVRQVDVYSDGSVVVREVTPEPEPEDPKTDPTDPADPKPDPKPTDPVVGGNGPAPKLVYAQPKVNCEHAMVRVDPGPGDVHVDFYVNGEPLTYETPLGVKPGTAFDPPYSAAVTLPNGQTSVVTAVTTFADGTVSKPLAIPITYDVKWSQVIDVEAGDLASVYAAKAKPGVLFRVSGVLKGTFKPTKSGEAGKPIGVSGLTVDGSGKSIAVDGHDADHVALYDLKVTGAKNAQGGHNAGVQAGNYWVLKNADVSQVDRTGTGVAEWDKPKRGATGGVFVGVVSHDNGQNGISYTRASNWLEVDCSTWRNNHDKKYSATGESGGGKWARVDHVMAVRRTSYENVGPALWTDIQNEGTVIIGLLSYGNRNRSNPWEGAGSPIFEIAKVGSRHRVYYCWVKASNEGVGAGVHESGGIVFRGCKLENGVEFRRFLRKDGDWDLGHVRIIDCDLGYIEISQAWDQKGPGSGGGYKAGDLAKFDIKIAKNNRFLMPGKEVLHAGKWKTLQEAGIRLE